jgi:hypothetical protein
MTEDDSEPEIAEAELDAQIARSGLQLSPSERNNVLTAAQYLQRAAALVRAYNPVARENED